jgi:hypothetical protein
VIPRTKSSRPLAHHNRNRISANNAPERIRHRSRVLLALSYVLIYTRLLACTQSLISAYPIFDHQEHPPTSTVKIYAPNIICPIDFGLFASLPQFLIHKTGPRPHQEGCLGVFLVGVKQDARSFRRPQEIRKMSLSDRVTLSDQ